MKSDFERLIELVESADFLTVLPSERASELPWKGFGVDLDEKGSPIELRLYLNNLNDSSDSVVFIRPTDEILFVFGNVEAKDCTITFYTRRLVNDR